MLMTTKVPEHTDPVTHACALHEAAMACYAAGQARQAASLWRRALRGLEALAARARTACEALELPDLRPETLDGRASRAEAGVISPSASRP